MKVEMENEQSSGSKEKETEQHKENKQAHTDLSGVAGEKQQQGQNARKRKSTMKR